MMLIIKGYSLADTFISYFPRPVKQNAQKRLMRISHFTAITPSILECMRKQIRELVTNIATSRLSA